MADYDIFRERLAIKYPSYGHALWEPGPRNPDRPVQIGDVGFILRGKFYRLFNALLPADDPSHVLGVPEYYEPLIPTLVDHPDTRSLGHNNFCSPWVSMEPDPGYHSGPNEYRQVSFRYERTRGAAVLSLPVAARREDTLAQDEFKRWILKHIDSWFAFARELGMGIQHMEEIILVTGCDLTKSWTNIAFLGGQVGAHVSFRVKVEEPNTGIYFQFLPENARGAVLHHGPEGPGANLPENQCVFIRGFRVVRPFWKLPRRIEAAAGPSPDPGGYDHDSDAEVISIPANTQYRDPLHLLLDYIAEKATDCDMVLVHDNDLGTIGGLGRDSSIETLGPDVMTDLLRRSDMKINKYDVSLTDRVPNTDAAATVVKVAMLSMTSQNWNTQIGPQSQWSRPASQNVDLSYTSQSRESSSSALPGGLRAPFGGDTVDLNNYLQRFKGKNLTQYLRLTSQQTGPDNQALHTATYTFRSVTIGKGQDISKSAAKRQAANQALQYFHVNGIPE